MNANIFRHLFGIATTLWVIFAVAPQAGAQWYVSGNAGAVYTMDADTPITAAGITVNGDAVFDPGFVVSGATGYAFGNLRIEGEIAYRKLDIDKFNATSVTGAGFGTITVAGTVPFADTKTSSISLMANAWYDVTSNSPWRPYIGGGAGVAFTRVEFSQADTGGNRFIAADTVLAYQLGVGLDYDITPDVAVGVSYRYFGTTDPSYSDAISGTPFTIDTEIGAHNILAGLKLKL